MNVPLKTSVTKTLAVITVCTFVVCCNGKKGTQKTDGSSSSKPIEKFYGNWLCSDLFDSINARKSMTSIFDPLVLPYAYEMQFDESFNDSVLIYNGFEQYFLQVIIKRDSVIFDNAVQGNPLTLIYDSANATLKIISSSKYDHIPLSAFKKADEKYIQPNGRYAETFPSAFNESTVAGSYTLMSNNTGWSSTIDFKMNGELSGYDGGLHYTCCTGGDCLGMMQKPMNTLSIIMEDKPAENWGWHLSAHSDTLTLMKVKETNSEEPGSYRPTTEILKLVRDK